MKSFDTELQKYAEKIRLKASERKELRERVLSYMEYHPLPKQYAKQQITTLTTEHPFFILNFGSRMVRIASGVFVLVLLVAIPLFAERSVPGDVLYLVKTGVNEGVSAQFANSPYEKVTFETKLIERRIAEARLLASEGKLTEEVGAQIAETVKGHADAAQSGLAEMRTDNADEAAIAQIAFSSALEVQSAVLDTNKSTDATSSTNTILDVVNTVRGEVVSDQETTTPSFEGLMASIERETTRAYELSETIKKTITVEEQDDIARRLSDIDRKIVGAKEARTTDEVSAIGDLVSSLGLIQKLIVFMTDIDVHETVTLETLVPVELTTEERAAIVQTAVEEGLKIQREVAIKIPLITDTGVLEKVTLGMSTYADLVGAATSSLEQGDIDTAEARMHEAEAFILDIAQMLSAIVVEQPEVTPETLVPELEGLSTTTATTTIQTPTDTTEGQVGEEGGSVEAIE